MAKTFVGIPSIYPKLLELRKSKTAALKANKYLRSDVKLRYYQVIGAIHMVLLERMILGDSTGLGKCVSGDTFISTNKGLIRMSSLFPENPKEDTLYPLPEDLVLQTHKGKAKPSCLYYCGTKSGLEITTHRGFQETGLRHHPILVANDEGLVYKRLDQLQIGDMVAIKRGGLFSESFIKCPIPELKVKVKEYSIPPYLDEDLGKLIGFYIAEGSSPHKWGFSIEQHDEEVSGLIRTLLEDCFGYKETGKNKSLKKTIIVNSKMILDCCAGLGVDFLAKSGDKEIPWAIMQSPKSIVRSFLQGYFEGDGCVESASTGGVSCCSKSEKLVRQIQLVLLNFGIVSRIRKKMILVKDKRRPYWILYFHGKNIDLFKSEIGFLSCRKKKILSSKCGGSRNTNVDCIPFGSSLIKNSMKSIISFLRGCPDQKGFSIKGSGWKGLVGLEKKKVVESVIYKTRRLTYERLRDFIDLIDINGLGPEVGNYSDLKDTLGQNLFFDKITSIEAKKSVFADFHVPDGHNFVGNGFINHNTLQVIAAYIVLLERDPTLKLLVVCRKSALFQWQEEFEKFTVGVTSLVVTNKFNKKNGYKARKEQYDLFKEHVMIIGYNPLLDEYEKIKESMGSNYMAVFDECVAFKGRKTKTHFACSQITESASRAYGLSATIIKNGLEEVFGIYAVIVPGLFGRITHFKEKFCIQKMIPVMIRGRRRKIPQITGYKNLKEFKKTLDPYFLIRKKQEVASELPKLISRKIILEMGSVQKELYRSALSGILYEERIKHDYFEIDTQVRNGSTDERTLAKHVELKEKYDKFTTDEGKRRGKLAALTYCQMVSNGPGLLNEEGDSSKEEEFIRLMLDELSTEKVIMYTRFKSGLPFLETACNKNKIKYVRITGDENDKERRDARIKFQESTDCNLIFITSAGSESLNLQSASTVIFYDTPWSYGDLVQTIGRAQRIGSLQDHILLIHLVNKGTIDVRIMGRVSDKKELSDEVLGDTAEGALDFSYSEDNALNDLFDSLLKDAEGLK